MTTTRNPGRRYAIVYRPLGWDRLVLGVATRMVIRHLEEDGRLHEIRIYDGRGEYLNYLTFDNLPAALQ